MLSELFDWWARQMAGLVPDGWRRRDVGGGDGWVLRADAALAEGRLHLSRRQRGRLADLGSFALDASGRAALRQAVGSGRAPVLLHLPQALLLERDAVLPLAAETELDRVLGYEMDRITPFAAAELFWSWRLTRRDRTHGRLHLRLSMVQRARVAELVQALAALGLAPTRLVLPGADGTPRLIPLERGASAARPRAVRWAAGLCAVLAVAVLATPFLRDLRAIDAADRRIAALKPRVALVDGLRARIAASSGSADIFAAELARIGNPLRALDALTEILPDDTVLSTFSLRQRVITFSGVSAGAARLIPALAGDPVLRNPAFTTPVTRPDGGGDQFSIRAELGL